MKVFFSDFETPTKTTIDKYKGMVCAPYLVGTVSLESDKVYYHITLHDWFNWLMCKKKTIKVYFHNLKFDGEMITTYLMSQGYFPSKEKKLNKNEFIIFEDTNSLYKIQVRTPHNLIHFVCSYKIFMNTIEQMGLDLGDTTKQEINYHDYYKFNSVGEVPEKLLKYIGNDVLIMKKTYKYFSDNYTPKLTISSTSFDNMKKYFGGEWYYLFGVSESYYKSKKIFFNTNDYKLFRPGYRGGICNGRSDIVGKTMYNVNCYDVNGMYHSIMRNNILPYRHLLKEKPLTGEYIEIISVQIISGTKKDKYSNLPPMWYNVRDAKYQNIVINEICVYNKFEWDVLNELYDFDFKIINRWYIRGKVIFNDYLDFLTEKRLNSINKTEKTIHKFIANGGSGKFGQNPVRVIKKLTQVNDGEKIRKGVTVYLRLIEGNVERWVKKRFVEINEKCNYMPLIMTVTAYGRSILMTIALKHYESLLYYDTDSVWLLDTELNESLVDDKKIGFWKKEHTCLRFKYLRPKCYIYECHSNCRCNEPNIYVKCSGMNKATKNRFMKNRSEKEREKYGNDLSWDDFKIGAIFPSGKTVARRYKMGVVIVDEQFIINE